MMWLVDKKKAVKKTESVVLVNEKKKTPKVCLYGFTIAIILALSAVSDFI